MTNFVINTDQDTTLTIDGTNNTWFINYDVTLEVAGTAIRAEEDDESSTVNVSGKAISRGAFDAISIDGDFDFVNVATSGKVYSTQGAGVFFGTGSGNSLLNEGLIVGKTFGFLGSATDTEIDNFGVIRSEGIAVKTGSGIESELSLENSGTIQTKGNVAILGGKGVERIFNDGHIEGHVRLGDNYDYFVFGKGTVDGKVYGGNGNDTYMLGRHPGNIVETLDGGNDVIISGKTHVLGENIERLSLTGSKDIAGTGNSLANTLLGNDGDNIFKGLGGVDYLDGRGGNDDLYGGKGADRFIMGVDNGRDRIFDFAVNGANHDIVDVSSQFDAGSKTYEFDDLKTHLSQHGENVWIDFDEGERMILKNVDIEDLTQFHFSYDIV